METREVGLVENKLTFQHILHKVIAETSSDEWDDYKQAPVVPEPASRIYAGSGESTFTSTLISNTDDGTKGKQSYNTSSFDLGSKMIQGKNVPGPAYNNLPWQRSVTFDYGKVTSDYEAKHEFTLDAAGVQSATNGKLESNSNSLVLHDVAARDEDKIIVPAGQFDEDGQPIVPGELDTTLKYKKTVTTKEESHDKGEYSGQLRGNDSYSEASGTVTEKKTITDSTDAVFKQDGWGDDGHRYHRETHGFNPTPGVAQGNGKTVTTLDRTQKYDADQIKTTSEISEQNYSAVFTTEAKSTWIGSQGAYGLSDSNFTRQTWHIKNTTDADGTVTTDNDSKSEANVAAYEYSPLHPEGVLREDYPFTYHIDPNGNIQKGEAKRLPAAGPSNSGFVDDRISDWEAGVTGFFKGLKAGWYTLVDAYTPDFAVDVSEAKADAWKDARLNGTWTQTISEGAVAVSREAALMAATSGGSLVCGTSRLAAIATATARTTALAVEVYDGYQNVVAAHQNFQEGNVWTGLYHAGLAVLNVIGVKGGIRQLKNDVHIAAFPGDHCYPSGTPIATEFGLRPIESIERHDRVWSFNLATSEWELCRVAETYSREHEGALVGVFVGGGKIESTYHHPYWVVEGEDLADRPEPDHVRAATVRDAIIPGRWVDAGDLRIGDVLLLQDGRRLPIDEIILRQATCRVYNLAVEGLRNYAIGPCSVLAHNMCAAAVKAPTAPSTESSLKGAAQRAHATVGAGSGAVHGTRVHTAFEAEVRGIGNANLRTEVSYLNGQVVRRGTSGSVRLDVVEGPISVPTGVFDLKTGSAKLTTARIEQIRQHIPGGANIPVIAIR